MGWNSLSLGPFDAIEGDLTPSAAALSHANNRKIWGQLLKSLYRPDFLWGCILRCRRKRIRFSLVRLLGTQPFGGVYSLVALGTFIQMVVVFGTISMQALYFGTCAMSRLREA